MSAIDAPSECPTRIGRSIPSVREELGQRLERLAVHVVDSERRLRGRPSRRSRSANTRRPDSRSPPPPRPETRATSKRSRALRAGTRAYGRAARRRRCARPRGGGRPTSTNDRWGCCDARQRKDRTRIAPTCRTRSAPGSRARRASALARRDRAFPVDGAGARARVELLVVQQRLEHELDAPPRAAASPPGTRPRCAASASGAAVRSRRRPVRGRACARRHRASRRPPRRRRPPSPECGTPSAHRLRRG